LRRPISSYRQDSSGDWIAELTCGHGQHVRHRPPFFERSWVTTVEGRTSMLGSPLDCVRCDRLELPEGLVSYRRTPEFDEGSIPDALRKDHSTKPGVWGLIHVVSGRLRYSVELGGQTFLLDPESPPGVVVPEALHQVEPQGPVRFYVEFLQLR
jgi:tellurite methyltransferase